MERDQAIDQVLLVHVSRLSREGQRWLKTALLAVELTGVGEEAPEAAGRPYAREPGVTPDTRRRAASLEDVITGQADLREQLEAYPELAEELEGLADIIDLLRETGKARRKRGERILREEIMGERPQPAEGEDDGELS